MIEYIFSFLVHETAINKIRYIFYFCLSRGHGGDPDSKRSSVPLFVVKSNITQPVLRMRPQKPRPRIKIIGNQRSHPVQGHSVPAYACILQPASRAIMTPQHEGNTEHVCSILVLGVKQYADEQRNKVIYINT